MTRQPRPLTKGNLNWLPPRNRDASLFAALASCSALKHKITVASWSCFAIMCFLIAVIELCANETILTSSATLGSHRLHTAYSLTLCNVKWVRHLLLTSVTRRDVGFGMEREKRVFSSKLNTTDRDGEKKDRLSVIQCGTDKERDREREIQ